ncbi:MAG: RNA polymerase factor sigma-32 [Deltaproteobacteria bacterium]|nr:RNA polymerase factor sigma-32 [Deltaproteobacteria bacterium]
MLPPGKERKPRAKKGEKPAPEPIEAEVSTDGEAEPDVEGAEPSPAELAEVEPAEAPLKPAKALAPLRPGGARDALQQYMNEVGRYKLLTREEEHALAVKYRDTGDLEAARTLIASNLRLVVKIAFEYHRTAFNVLDLIQEGNVGLMHAVKKFDPYKNVKLSTYAAWWIRAFILRYVMENWRMVKLGTTQAQRKLFFNLRKERDRLLQQGFDPTPKLLAQRLDVTEQDVTDMERRLGNDEVSLEAPVGDDSRQSQGDRIPETSQAIDEKLGDQELLQRFQQELAAFAKTITDDKERFIFEKRLTSDEPLKLQEIGDHFGVSRERARQIEAKLIGRLKAHVQAKLPDFKELSFERED